MKRFLPIFIFSILCIGLFAQDRNPRRIEVPETDSLVYIHQKLNDSNIKIYGDIVDGTQYGGDTVNGINWFKKNVVEKNNIKCILFVDDVRDCTYSSYKIKALKQ